MVELSRHVWKKCLSKWLFRLNQSIVYKGHDVWNRNEMKWVYVENFNLLGQSWHDISPRQLELVAVRQIGSLRLAD